MSILDLQKQPFLSEGRKRSHVTLLGEESWAECWSLGEPGIEEQVKE